MQDNNSELPILEHQPDATPLESAEAKPQLPDYFYHTNERGLIEAVDKITGRVLCVQVSAQDLLKEKWERLVRIDTPEGPVWLERGLNFDLVAKLQAIPYSRVLGDLICEKIATGATLIGACKELNLKYSIVLGWKREHQEFALAILQAETDRADSLHDEVVDEARANATTKDKIAALQWSAEKTNKEKYGKQEKSGPMQGNVTIVIGTGIMRPGDQGYIAPPKEVVEIGTQSVLPERQEEEIAYTGGMKSE